jgi:4-hydroxybenzoate polyprenyltransferase
MNKLRGHINNSKLFPLLDLMRLNKPIGIWLLFLPCLFGIALAAKYNSKIDFIYIIFLFFSGSVLMRSAGCIINDLFDQKYDQKVARTKSRPLACGQVSRAEAIILLIILLSCSFLILLQFNHLAIGIGFFALLLTVLYPLCKRFTYYPQAFLGLTFNIGILLSCAAILKDLTLSAVLLYIGAIFWTIIYDTIYAYQDIEDDIKIGVKSTSLRFGAKPQKILYGLIFLQILFLFLAGFIANLKLGYHLFILAAAFHLICQVRSCDFSDQNQCLQKFKSNFWVGIIILIGLISG